MRDVLLVLGDLENGYSAALAVADESVELVAGADSVEIPLGPLLVRGTLDEWCDVIDREVSEIVPLESLPVVVGPESWSGERRPFPIVDSE